MSDTRRIVSLSEARAIALEGLERAERLRDQSVLGSDPTENDDATREPLSEADIVVTRKWILDHGKNFAGLRTWITLCDSHEALRSRLVELERVSQRIPKKIPKEQLLILIDNLKALIEDDDSMEGTLTYRWGAERGVYEVEAFLRTGNSYGQGGSIVIQGDRET